MPEEKQGFIRERDALAGGEAVALPISNKVPEEGRSGGQPSRLLTILRSDHFEFWVRVFFVFTVPLTRLCWGRAARGSGLGRVRSPGLKHSREFEKHDTCFQGVVPWVIHLVSIQRNPTL